MKHEFTTEKELGLAAGSSGGGKTKANKSGAARNLPVPKFDVCITTYEMLTANPEAFKVSHQLQ